MTGDAPSTHQTQWKLAPRNPHREEWRQRRVQEYKNAGARILSSFKFNVSLEACVCGTRHDKKRDIKNRIAVDAPNTHQTQWKLALRDHHREEWRQRRVPEYKNAGAWILSRFKFNVSLKMCVCGARHDKQRDVKAG